MSLQSFQETLISAPGDGAAITAASATSLLPVTAKYPLPPHFMQAGRQLRITASGRISSVITTPGTARFDVRFSGTVVWDGLAILLDTVAAHTNVGWWLEILLTCRSVGAAAQLIGSGKWSCEDILGVPSTAPKGSLTAMLPWNLAPALGTAFDSSASQTVDLFFTQTVATGSVQLHQYNLESLN